MTYREHRLIEPGTPLYHYAGMKYLPEFGIHMVAKGFNNISYRIKNVHVRFEDVASAIESDRMCGSAGSFHKLPAIRALDVYRGIINFNYCSSAREKLVASGIRSSLEEYGAKPHGVPRLDI